MSYHPITRQEESELPVFNSYKEANNYFDSKYGKDFILEDVDKINEEYCYFHALVFDHAAYRKGRSQLKLGIPLTGNLAMEYLKSYQSIQIFENGHVHIVH